MVIPCEDLDRAQRFFTTELGFGTDAVFQLDHLSIVVMPGPVGPIWLLRRHTGSSTVDSDFRLIVPPLQQSLVINKVKDQGAWHEGRVKEMLYRDLIPGRQGGRFIASCIRILNGG